MTEKKVAQETVSKALESLQELVKKGHSSGGTATTAVETMRDAGAGAGSSSGSTQVFHTPSNSDPKGWAGSSAEDVSEDGATDGIDANGTDYKGASAGLVKSIMEKLAKGQALTEAEQFVLKSLVKSDDNDEDDTKKGAFPPANQEDEEDDKKMGKSLSDHASENSDVSKGLELSPFLAGWAEVQAEAAASMEESIVQRIHKSLARIDEENSQFQVEMAKSISALAEVMALQGQRLDQIESTPARGPKSVTAIDKSFGAGGAPQQQGEDLTKSQVIDTMLDMVQKGSLHAQEVVKFESTSELRPDLYQAVLAHRQGR